jgi:subtilase family serine protease
VPVKLGSNTVLSVQLIGNPSPDIRWYHNGALLTNATGVTLTIPNTQFADAGYYQLTASNYLGVATSYSVYVKVYQDTDLQPLSISVPPVVSSSAVLPLVWTVTNTGPASVVSFYDNFGFTVPVVTPGYTTGPVFSSVYHGVSVPPASVYSVTNTTYRLSLIPAGTYTLMVNVDVNNDIIETDEQNNSLTNTVPITVINPDLQPGDLRVSAANVLGNSTVQFTYNLTNNGPGVLDGAAFYDELFLSTNAALNDAAIALRQINQSPTLGAGAYFTVTNTFTVPLVPSGDYYLVLHVDHFGYQDVGYLWETNELNNFAVLPLHIQQSDLVPTNVVAPALVSSRQPVQISWNDFNQGDGLATNTTFISLYDDVYLSTNQSVNGSAIKLGNYYYYDFNGYQVYQNQDFYWNAAVAPGQAFTNSQNVIIPNVAAGDYYLVVSVDTANAIREIVETNNTLAVPITLGTLDLSPVTFTVPPAANTRSTISVAWAVTNLGAGTVYPQWVDRVFISTNATFDRSATLLGEFVQTNALAAGAAYAATNAITLNGVGAGNYYLLFVADAATNVVETTRGNNVVASPLVINSPDLVAASLTVNPVFSSQQPISAVYSVSNASSVTAYAGWSDRLYLSPDGIVESNNIPLIYGYDYFSGAPYLDLVHDSDLAGGDSYSQLANSTVPPVAAGDYFVLLQANANNFFAENNTANNLLAKPVHINNPDLVLTNFAAPSVIVLTQYNQSFEADWSVLNQGAGDAYVSWSDRLYLSPTNVLDTNAISIGLAGQSPMLASGQSYLSFTDGRLPDGIQGDYYLLLQANDSRSLYESTYTNNFVARPVSLVVPPVPVLSVVTVDSPADAWSGQQIYVTWTLTNSGTASVSGTFNDVVYLCNSSTGGNPQPYGTFQFTGEIPPGQSVVRQQKIFLPIDLQGTFWVALQTDANRNIFEFTYRTNEFLVANHPLTVHLTPTPNLVIASLTAPTNLFSGGEGTVSWVETNSGSGPTSAPFWDDAVYLCDTTNYYTANYRVLLAAPNNVAYLNPGDSYAGSANVTLPRGISGTFYFIVWADSGNNVYEWTNENDNMLTSEPVFIQPSPTPDLQVATVQPPHDAFSGQPVLLKYAVTNFGLGQTQPNESQWYDRVYLSASATLDGSAKYLGDLVHNGGLPAGAGYEVTTNSITLPVGVSGDWYFIVSADIYNNVYEAAFEDNNAGTAAYATHISLTPPPDLETTILQAPTNLAAAHSLVVTYSVFNNGTTITPNSGWNDNLYLWTNSVFDAAHATYLTTVSHYGALPPGAGYTNTFAVTLPVNLVGTNYIFVQSDAGNAVFELNKTNNLAGPTNPVVIEFRPSDLAVTGLTAPATANAGAGILVNWAVTNLGVGDTAVSTWNDRLILSQNILPGAPSDVQLLQLQHNGLIGTNAGYAVSNQLAPIPPTVGAGHYQLFLVTDANGNVPVETNRNNNVFGPVPITITTHSPDLQVATASGPASALSGSTVTVNWTVINAGDLPANASYWYDTVYLSPDGLLGPDAIRLGSRQNARSLLSGETYTNSLAVTLPVNVQSNYYFVVVVDGYNYIPEAGAEGNNTYVVTPPVFITLSPTPDVAVTSVNTPATAYEGQNFHLSWVVKNIGTTNATGAWYDVAYLSADQILDPALDPYLGYTYQSHNLAPGESYTNSADLPIPQGLAGPFYVFVTTDPSHVLNERGQWTNNTAYNPQAMQVQLLPPVDLVAGNVTIPVNAVPGRNMTVSYTVQNQGENTAIGSWVDSLFISADTNWDIGDKFFARVTHNGDVPPGGSYTNTVTAALPGVLPGDYHVIVRSDILNHLTEANKSNNIAASLNSAEMDVERLTLGTPAGDTIASGQSAFYKFDATNGQTIHLQFSSDAVLSDNELFVKFGQMPDSGNFDAAANAPFAASPQIYLAVTNTGTYYVLVKCNYLPTATPYTVLAEVLPFTVREVQPNIASDAGQTTFFVRGALFDGATQFALQQSDRTIDAQSVYLADSTAAYVTFNLNGAPNGEWDFAAAMTDSASNVVITTLTNAVLVGSMDPVDPDVSIDGPLAVREPREGSATHSCLVDYGNSGYSDLAPPLILVQSRDGTTLGTTLNNLRTNTVQLLGRSLVGPPDILRPQSQASKILYFRGGGTHLSVWTLAADSTREITDEDWQDIENSVRPDGISDADWLNFWVNIRPRLGSTWGDYVQFLDRVAKDFPAEQREVSAMFLSLYTNAPGFRASASLSGTLLGATDGLPQTNVEVDLMTLDTNTYAGAVVARAQTDAAGRFTFPFVAPGQYYYSVADSLFDMDRDGQADTQLAGILMTNTDLTDQTVYLYQPPPKASVTVTNDEDAQLVLDSANVLHAFWYRNSALWHAWDNKGQWVDASVIASNISGSFAVGTSAKLIGGTSPGLMAVWTEGTTNSIEVFYSAGQRVGNGYQWSQPVALTGDAIAQNASPAIAVRPDGEAVVSYLKIGPAAHDDSDVYFSPVALSPDNLVWHSSPSLLLQPHDVNVDLDNLAISFSTKKDVKVDLGSYDLGFSVAFALNGGVGGCSANASGSASVTATATTPQFGLTVSGGGSEKFMWQINPEQCAWEFKNATVDANAKIDFELKGALSLFLHGFPHPAVQAIGTGVDKMTDWARAKGVLLENSVSIGAGLGFQGIAWTHPPAPIPDWRTPDVFGKALVTVNAGAKLGVKTVARADQVMEYTQSGESYNYIVPGLHTNESSTTYGLEGQAQIQAVFEVYPSPHIRSLVPSGQLKLSWSPYFSYTYPIAGTPIIIDHAKPKAGQNDPLPDGWYFTYDPDAFIGTTNVYGTNAVLDNVANDLYQDGAPALAVDGNGTPFQVWYKFEDPHAAQPGSEIYVADFNGVKWNAPVVIPGSLGLNSQVTATTDALGRRLAVWVHGDSSGITTNLTYDEFTAIDSSNDVCFAVFDGTSWSAPQPVGFTAGKDTDLQLSRMDNGNVLAVWIYTDADGGQRLVSSQWNGGSWSAIAEITSGQVSAPAAQQVAGVTYLLWTQVADTNRNHTLYLSQNSGAGWSAPTPFAPALLDDSAAPAIVTPKAGNLSASLAAIQTVSDLLHKRCCKCDKGVSDLNTNRNTGCGISSIDYDYEHCHRIYTYLPCQVRPLDPNNIVGPEGFGPERWVSAGAPLAYTIQFENDPVLASAPATRVSITLPLDEHFDPRTFRLGDFGFGGMIFNIPPGSAFYQTRVDLSATKGYYVDLVAGVDIVNRQAFWTLTTIDPVTGDVPQNAAAGFLPPNNNPPEGEGFVSCSVTPLAGVANGSPVAAQATIVFDNQPPMDTPSALNTLQTSQPASQVLPLPALTLTPTFDVAWQGTGTDGGSGITAYDIYASENGGIYYPWLQGTTLNHAPFVGQPGGTYAFYSIAHDNVGNVQPTPTNADAITFVSSNLPPVLPPLTNWVVAPDSSVFIRIPATDPNGDNLAYSLLAAPADATIGTNNGIFRWRPTRALAETTNYVTVAVTDDGVPPLGTNQTFAIIVQDYLELSLGETNLEGGQTASIPVSLASNDGVTNLIFTVQAPENLLTNWAVAATVPQVGSATLQDRVTNLLITLNAAPGQSLQGTQSVSTLTFTAITNQVSGFITLPVTSVTAVKPGAAGYANYITHAGTVIVVQNEPLLRAGLAPDQSRSLQLYGKPGVNYQLLFSTNLAAPSDWQPLLNYTQTNGVITLPLDSSNPVIFYRLRQP